MTILLILIIVVLSVMMVFFAILVKYITEEISLQKVIDREMWHLVEKVWFATLNKKADRSRHRDERLLRELHKSMQDSEYYHNDLNADHTILATDIKGLAKQLRSIENVQGKCKNDGIEVKDGVLQIRKNLTASGKILAELQSILDKAKKRS
jgi:hypothetical protein